MLLISRTVVPATDAGNSTIGRITTSGTVTIYHHTGIADPAQITVGPDRALWFTNSANTNSPVGSVGRITIAGKITIYTAPGISIPLGITAGPAGALWFADNGNNTIGRITTTVTP